MKTLIHRSDEFDIWFNEQTNIFEVFWKTVVGKKEIVSVQNTIRGQVKPGESYMYCSNMESAVYSSELEDDYDDMPRLKDFLPNLGFRRFAIVLGTPEHKKMLDTFLLRQPSSSVEVFTTTNHDLAMEWLENQLVHSVSSRS